MPPLRLAWTSPRIEVIWWDQHNYQNPEWMIDSFDMYDNYPRNNTKVFQGEYAQTHLGDDVWRGNVT
jgi:hypothetical protein